MGAGRKKATSPAWRLFVLGILAGFLIGMGAVVASVCNHAMTNASVSKIVSGVMFAPCLGMVVMSGAELFTGNCLIIIPVLEKKLAAVKMLRNWVIVYLGNLCGGLILSCMWIYAGGANVSDGALAVSIIKAAAAKCSLGFPQAVILGIGCNFLVCAAVMFALSAVDVPGKVLGTFLPVMFFVIAGFEHSIANMTYIPMGLFALGNSAYVEKAAAAGVNIAAVTWGNFFLRNLLPVTIGNIIGGCLFGLIMWSCHRQGKAAA